MASDDTIKYIGKVLNDNSRPLKERFRALFTLKNIGGSLALDCINECFSDDSALLKHELAYCMGQMQDKNAIPFLEKVLNDVTQEPMVRHEAGEALGAIGCPQVKYILESYVDDPVEEVAETCQIALERLNWLESHNEDLETLPKNPYLSVDPAPPANGEKVSDLKEKLLDKSNSLFERYRAMFTLRNMRTADSIAALGEGLRGSSALFRHEVAFVLGQLQDPRSILDLTITLKDLEENEMVRHEAAEALGAIGTLECMEILRDYLKDKKRVVRESCEVALDMCEYENSPEFQYANTLSTLNTDSVDIKY